MSERHDLQSSRAVGTMIEMPAICGKHVIYYPGLLASLAVQDRVFCVFATTCECGEGYLIATQDTGAHVRMVGSLVAISQEYEAVPWPEYQHQDPHGVFFYKRAPSLEALFAYFEEREKAIEA